jgi:23S rRNA (adenine2030-N6)-methyltransferase
VARWLGLAQRFNGSGALKRYPGSPWLARESLRPIDDLFLFELHPAEHRALKKACEADRRAKVLREDGLTAAIGLVPPPSKRALTFVDPSYELRDEHRTVIDAVVSPDAATGVVTVYYPSSSVFVRSLRGARAAGARMSQPSSSVSRASAAAAA